MEWRQWSGASGVAAVAGHELAAAPPHDRQHGSGIRRSRNGGDLGHVNRPKRHPGRGWHLPKRVALWAFIRVYAKDEQARVTTTWRRRSSASCTPWRTRRR